MIKLSLLVPTIKRDKVLFASLKKEIERQMEPYGDEVELLVDYSEEDSVGTKRNRLLKTAVGSRVVFLDSDDSVCENYIDLLMTSIEKDTDCASLIGIITFDGQNPQYFEHSIRYSEYKTNERADFYKSQIKYERFPNHLSCIRSSIAKQFQFPEINFGEDTDWATQIYKSGLIKTEHYIPEVLYYYKYKTNKEMSEPRTTFSQGSEDAFIMEIFENWESGKFIDIGAFAPEALSNVRALYNTGKWGGCLIEPAVSNYNALVDAYKHDDRIVVLNVAIGTGSKTIDFWDSGGDAIGSGNLSHVERWSAAGVKYTKTEVQQIDTAEFMEMYARDADMISLDVESQNMEVFKSIPDWVWERITLFIIEHDNEVEEIEAKLHPFGFETLHINGENIILSKP